MGFTFGAVYTSTKQFGKIIEDKGKNFLVILSTGQVVETGHPVARKVVLNSPTFFSLIQPERNPELFESDPVQLIREILWERRCLSADPQGRSKNRPGAQSTIALKKTVLGYGVPAPNWGKMWPNLRKELTAEESGVGSDGSEFWLSTPELKISGEISVDWESFMSVKISPATPNADGDLTKIDHRESQASSAAKSEVRSKNAPQADQTHTDPWLAFLAKLESRSSETSGSAIEALRVLELFPALEQRFLSLAAPTKAQLSTALTRTGSTEAYLLGAMLTTTPIEQKRKIGQSAHALAIEVFEQSVRSHGSLSTGQRVALSRLVLTAPGATTSQIIRNDQYGQFSALVLSLTSPDLLEIKASIVLELAKRIKLAPAGALDGVSQVLTLLPWGTPLRQPLAEALLSHSSPETKTPDFWNGLDIKSVLWLSSLSKWPTLINRSTSRALVQTALEKSLAASNAAACWEVLNNLDILGQLISQGAIDSLVVRALQSNPRTTNTLSAMSREGELMALDAELRNAQSTAEERLKTVEESGMRVAELLLEVEVLSGKLLAAGDQVGKMRDSQRLQYELDAAKTLARILSTLDNELGPGYQGRDRVVSEGKRLGLSQIFVTGGTETFAHSTCDDPEDEAVEGDSVKIIASGFNWSGGDQSVVLLKALVSKI